MLDLIKKISTEAHLSTDDTIKVLEILKKEMQEKFPKSITEQFDEVLAGKAFDYQAVFNEKLEHIKHNANDTFKEVGHIAAEKIEDFTEQAQKIFKRLLQ